MRFNGLNTYLTPPEAAYIEDVCSFKPEGTPADDIKWKVRAGLLDWAAPLSGSEPAPIDHPGKYHARRQAAEALWKESDGETITVELTGEDLKIVRELAHLQVERTLNRIRNDLPPVELNSSVESLVRNPFEPEIYRPGASPEDEATLRHQETWIQLGTAAIGGTIVATIDQHQPPESSP